MIETRLEEESTFDSYVPGFRQRIDTKVHIQLGLLATSNALGLGQLHDLYEKGLQPTDLQLADAFGRIVNGMVNQGILEETSTETAPSPTFQLTGIAVEKLEKIFLKPDNTQTAEERARRRRELTDFKAHGAPAVFLGKYIALNDDDAAKLITEGWQNTSDGDYELESLKRGQIDDLIVKMRVYNPFTEEAYAPGKQTPGERMRRVEGLPYFKAGGAPLEAVEEFLRMTDTQLQQLVEATETPLNPATQAQARIDDNARWERKFRR